MGEIAYKRLKGSRIAHKRLKGSRIACKRLKGSRIAYKRLKGSRNMRQRLLLATLSSTPIIIEDIRSNETIPGLRPHEMSLLDLFMKVTKGYKIKINDTGTKLTYKPGVVMGGNWEFDCGLSRSIGYFLEPLILLCLFGKEPLSIKLKGITNNSEDPSVDTFLSTTFPILKKFNVPSEGLGLKVVRRGVPPHGGGEVLLTVPVIQRLRAVNWTDEGKIQNIRGTAFSTRVGIWHEKELIHGARGIFDRFCPKFCYIRSDNATGQRSGNSPGYGISVFAKSDSGCFYSADTTISHPRKNETCYFVEEEKNKLIPAANAGEHVASLLLEEITRGGVVDSTHQGLLLLLCALCPEDVSKIRVGMLSPSAIETRENIKDFLRVEFISKKDPSSGTELLTCIGCGMKNLSTKLS